MPGQLVKESELSLAIVPTVLVYKCMLAVDGKKLQPCLSISDVCMRAGVILSLQSIIMVCIECIGANGKS